MRIKIKKIIFICNLINSKIYSTLVIKAKDVVSASVNFPR